MRTMAQRDAHKDRVLILAPDDSELKWINRKYSSLLERQQIKTKIANSQSR